MTSIKPNPKKARNRKDWQTPAPSAFMSEDLKGVQILSTGYIRDREYTAADLQEICDNTNRLISEGSHNPPGRLGHDDDQAFAKASGLPATGWVERLRVVGNKLVADFTDVPNILMRAFREKLFRKISSEIYFDFPHPTNGDKMGKVLRAVAFLGQDVPEVKGLADFLAEPGITPLRFADTAYERMGEVTITITVDDGCGEHAPEGPELEPQLIPGGPGSVTPAEPAPGMPNAPAPGPLTAEGLAGQDLENYRTAEKAVEALAGESIPEFEKERDVNGLLRYAGRVGAASINSSQPVRALSNDPDQFTAWLMAKANERGYVQADQTKGVSAMAATDTKEKDPKAVDPKAAPVDPKLAMPPAPVAPAPGAPVAPGAPAPEPKAMPGSDKERADAAEARVKELEGVLSGVKTELEKLNQAKKESEVAAFIEAHKAHITPAVEPLFRALCEAVVAETKTVKLSDKEETLTGLGIALRFASSLIGSKPVILGELTPKATDNDPEGSDAKPVKGANYRNELHAKAVKYQESNKGVSYMDAVTIVSKENPDLLKGE